MLEDHFYEKLQFSGPCRKADISCEALSANEENKNVCLLKNCYKLDNNICIYEMLYYFRHALAVNVESVLSQWRSRTFFFGLLKSSLALFFH